MKLRKPMLVISLIFVLICIQGIAGATDVAITPTPVPVATEATNSDFTWLILLPLIPLVGVAIYYYAFLRE